MSQERKAAIERVTRETSIRLSLNIDGKGCFTGTTGIGFFDHMLELTARHSLCDLSLEVAGDLHVDAHHTVEDVGIVFGQALNSALGEKKKIRRYGSICLPMDEALVLVALDLSGRPFLAYDVHVPVWTVGNFPTELVPEFFRALVNNAGLTLHLRLLSGENSHHIIEALFKGFGRALREAVSINPLETGIPSTKGRLES